MVKLFAHNQAAYEAAVAMLAHTGKAAVIHPTGTGKSFIALKWAADNPQATVLWLSPSEYIFKTQIENWKKTGGEDLPNLRFLTYAKLSIMTPEELKAINPQLAVYDEFHRGGAQIWQNGLTLLQQMYPNMPTLGLSATNIRYLDGQRDMADELFEGNIASQMTLGEAIVRGILTPPKYVLSIYSYQKDLERYQKRIRNARSKAVRDAGEKYLEALRRALKNADGIAEIFKKHIPQKNGKYLVFCASAEHMREMIDKVPEWFGAIDPQAHVYSAYSADPETNNAFQAFKQDESPHLKLLFCIDMLNEGVHVDNISGVILLRPTVSPIVYKQQIGRALSAGKNHSTVIFDIVMNIENLYSIGTIQQEMRAAITYYHYLGDDAAVVNEKFEIIDEVQDCRRLFDDLEQTLSASWELMYAEAQKYYASFGNLMVPAKYKTQDGYSLGSWVAAQRRIHNGEIPGHLTQKQTEQLEKIGIVWDNYRLRAWEQSFAAAEEYYRQFGDLRVPANYVTASGLHLGIWIHMMRMAKSNERTAIVTPEREARLNKIGMQWDVLSDQWEQNYREAKAYYLKNGNLLVPQNYVSPNGIKLGSWISHLRTNRKGNGKGKITPQQIERLNLIGMTWDADEEQWQMGLAEARKYYLQKGNLRVPAEYISGNGYPLGHWIRQKRRQYGKASLTQSQIRALECIGMVWDVHAEQWMTMYQAAQQYYRQNGNLNVPSRYRIENGQDLGMWLTKCRREKSKMTTERIAMLDAAGMVWERNA